MQSDLTRRRRVGSRVNTCGQGAAERDVILAGGSVLREPGVGRVVWDALHASKPIAVRLRLVLRPYPPKVCAAPERTHSAC